MKFNTASAVAMSESSARDTIAEMLGGESLDWPLDIDGMSELAGRLEYKATVDELRRLQSCGQIPEIAAFDGRDAISVLGCLEGRRQWRPSPSVHDPKKHPGRIAIEQAVNTGPDAVAVLLHEIRQFDLPLLLCLLAECDSREMREKLCNYLMLLRAGEYFDLSSPNLSQPAELADQFPHGDDEHG